jgi:hypothetical protein
LGDLAQEQRQGPIAANCDQLVAVILRRNAAAAASNADCLRSVLAEQMCAIGHREVSEAGPHTVAMKPESSPMGKRHTRLDLSDCHAALMPHDDGQPQEHGDDARQPAGDAKPETPSRRSSVRPQGQARF